MAEKIGSVWAIDIGNTSLKALRLSNETGTLQVIGFDHIHHGKILSGTGIKEQEKQELVALSLRQFVQQNEIGKDDVIVAVPSANSFARFVNLPPVEQKRIPEIVKFEASQQIPFDINEVTWDWQLMSDTGEARVGIFAIKNEVVTTELEHFSRENIQVGYVQIAPMALYNYIVYDRPDLTGSDTQATVVLNVGAETTDLIVCTKSYVWQRTIPSGGNAFTKAIADTFKLSFEKAEKLKRTAPMSKYARQILQAMKPVFTDLASEIQRSLGFYSNSHPNVKLTRVMALGGGTKMRGLLQYLQQSLQMPIERPDSFKRLALNSTVSAAKFHESVCDFGIVYGLAVQALGLGRIESNLLPRSVSRSMSWANKTKYFIGAACIVLVVSVLAFARAIIDRTSYSSRSATRAKIQSVLELANQAQSELEAQQGRKAAYEAEIKKEFDLFKNREIIPLVYEKIFEAIPNEKNNAAQSELYEAFNRGYAETVMKTPRQERKQIFITGLSVYYAPDLENAGFGTTGLENISNISEGRQAGGYDTGAMRRMMGDRRGEMGGPTGRSTRGQTVVRATVSTTSENRGFVITISGYSPYKEIGKLLDPAGVQDDPGRWGTITRLMDMNSMFEGPSPFEIYKKTDKQHFEIKTGEVDLNTEMPAGIGARKVTTVADGQESVSLIDPMTKEVISKEEAADETGGNITGKKQYKTNDHWFVLNFKLRWKDASASAAPMESEAGVVEQPPAAVRAPAAPPPRNTGGGRNQGVNFDE
ncbi:MAG: type IV pilus assembly protein PilM [Planctomycetota bacterium]